jgi:prevent-host-death family protein
MSEIGAFEAKNKLGSLLDRVEKGEEITITRRGIPVAKLVRAKPNFDREKARAAVQALLVLRKEIKGPPFTWEELKKYRDEGKR